MIIKRIAVRKFGSVPYYEAVLSPAINVLDTVFLSEISVAVEFVLCSTVVSERHVIGVCADTLISAEVLMGDGTYYIELKPTDENLLKLTALDEKENDVTDRYRRSLSHCIEQDSIDSFDGQDSSFPMKLCHYKDCGNSSRLLSRTNYVAGTQAFRSHLTRYIKNFKPQLINNQKEYKTAITEQGRFVVTHPDFSGEIRLSETEEKLFRYNCFLNVSEFWRDIETIRNMHHEEKPLLIKNFLEFLDYSVDINGLIARTVQLGRQVIIATLPMQEATKTQWTRICDVLSET